MNNNPMDRPARRVVFEFTRPPDRIDVSALPARLGASLATRRPHYIAYWASGSLVQGKAILLAVPVRAREPNLRAWAHLVFSRTRRQHLNGGPQFRSFSVALTSEEAHNFNFAKYDEEGNLQQLKDLNDIDKDNNDL